ncbi:MAG: noncanonical pyrimidine nucleotidase, YjjG family, partial [Bacteroidetes bacterium]
GIKKPNEEIFHYAMQKAGATVLESLMIGDDLDVDILGAKKVGMDQVLFDPNANQVVNNATYYITCLDGLKTFL